MSMNEMMNEKKAMFTVRNILRSLAMFCIICVFCPSFMVSCSGQNMDVSVMTAVSGVSVYGEKVVDSYPIMLICLVLPAVVLISLTISKSTNRKAALIAMGCSGIDIIVWMIFKTAVKAVAEENYCTFKTTAWFTWNMAALVVMTVAAFLVIAGKLQMDHDLTSSGIKAGGVGENFHLGSAGTKPNQREQVTGYCTNCGNPLTKGSKFCTSCGAPVDPGAAAERTSEEVAGVGKTSEKSVVVNEEERKTAE